MQLISLTLYSGNGDRKTIPFRTGALNVITGQSKTGKSVLVKLIDYCLGRSAVPTSAGAVERALAWVGALWQFEDGGRAFVGRPVPSIRYSENTRVMLQLGDESLQPPAYPELADNMNSRTMRLQLGARIGITESHIEPGGLRESFRTNLGHAALLCLQNQDEISSSTKIFHRSGERGIDDVLRDTLPYFLGAVAPDQALQRALLRQEQRRLQRAQRELRAAEDAAADIEADLLSLLTEAANVGLIEPLDGGAAQLDRDQIISQLRRAGRQQSEPGSAAPPQSPIVHQDASRRAQSELEEAEDQLTQLMEQRALLLDEAEGGSDYEEALVLQMGRLSSLDLLPLASDALADDEPQQDSALRQNAEPGERAAEGTPEATASSIQTGRTVSSCPVCGQATDDPTATEMRKSLVQLRAQLTNIRSATPAKSEALADINMQIDRTRTRIAAARAVQDAELGASATVGSELGRRRDFTRGRIDAILARVPQTDYNHIDSLRERVAVAENAVAALVATLSDDNARERLNSRLIGVGRTLTEYAQRLDLEHSERGVRIDLAQLTVIADVDDEPVPLHRIGSAENWIGYHVAGHLALHDTFIRHQRPVPRMLVVDQPSQGHYPSEVAKRTGRAETDADEIAVRALYQLMDDFTRFHEGKFQIIAVDHADIDEPWFQEAIVENWRGDDKKLIPLNWITAVQEERGDAAH